MPATEVDHDLALDRRPVQPDGQHTQDRDDVANERLRITRLKELETILPFLPTRGRILELGAGAGWLSRALAERGHSVDAIDVATSRYARQRVYDVRDYDGVQLPFPDGHFAAVLSSHVLEHVAQLDRVQAEIARVLAPGGVAVHMLPTPSWRFWSITSYYLLLPERFVARIRRRRRRGGAETSSARPSAARRSWYAAFPQPHGVTGNALTELYWFSRSRWRAIFRGAGWSILDCRPTRLFTMPFLRYHPVLGAHVMHWPSYVLGSSSLVWVMNWVPSDGDD